MILLNGWWYNNGEGCTDSYLSIIYRVEWIMYCPMWMIRIVTPSSSRTNSFEHKRVTNKICVNHNLWSISCCCCIISDSIYSVLFMDNLIDIGIGTFEISWWVEACVLSRNTHCCLSSTHICCCGMKMTMTSVAFSALLLFLIIVFVTNFSVFSLLFIISALETLSFWLVHSINLIPKQVSFSYIKIPPSEFPYPSWYPNGLYVT